MNASENPLNYPLNYPLNDLLFAYWWGRFRQEIEQGITTPNYIDTELHRLGRFASKAELHFQIRQPTT